METPCTWDGCDRLDAHDDPMFGDLCFDHMQQAYDEYHADIARKMANEDDIR